MYWLLKIISWSLSLLPIVVLYFLAKALAFFAYKILRIRKKMILSNLQIAFGKDKSKKELDKIAYLSVYSFALTILEFFSLRGQSLSKGVKIVEGEKYLKEIRDKKQGAYILCAHMGNWEAMGAALSSLGYQGHVVVKKVGGKGVDKFVREQRNSSGFLFIKRKVKGDVSRAIQKILKNNEFVGFVMDQYRPGEPFLPFFNKPARTNTSLAAIWRKFRAPIIPIYIIRKSFGKHDIYIKPPLELDLTDDLKKDKINHTIKFNSIVEDIIRSCPEQYFWLHNRWKD